MRHLVVVTGLASLAAIALLLWFNSHQLLTGNKSRTGTDVRNSAVIAKQHAAHVRSLNVRPTTATTTTTTSAPPHHEGDDEKEVIDVNDVPGADLSLFLRKRSLHGRLLLIPVNSGYLDFGLNLLCSLRKAADEEAASSRHRGAPSIISRPHHSVGRGFTFVAMDADVLATLRRMRLPVFQDPDMPFVSARSAAWADPKFHKLVCTKLIPVLRALRQNLTVVLSDADIVFRRDPSRYLSREGLDMIFSLGSCHRDLPDNYDLQAGDGLAKLNTGFYSANPTPALVDLFARALDRCSHSSELEGDQPAMNAVLDQNIHQHPRQNKKAQAQSGRVRYGFFDGCLFANGCIFFKHLCANSSSLDPSSAEAVAILRRGGKMPHHKIVAAGIGSGGLSKPLPLPLPPGHIRRDDPVLVHANFLVGKKDKIRHLRKAGLWYEECIAGFK